MLRRPCAADRRHFLQAAAAWPADAALAAPAGTPPLKLRLLAEPFPPLQHGTPTEPARGAAIDRVQATLALVADQQPLQAGAVEFLPLQRALMVASTLWAATGPDSGERLCALLTQAFATLQRSSRAAKLLEESMRSFNTLHRSDGG
jgi:hypothetical protein